METSGRFVAYYRVSTKSQENNTSLENQKKRIEFWAQTFRSVEIIAWIDAVESATCFTDDRRRFKEALDLIRRPDCEGLIVYDLDRFFRNAEEGLRIGRTEFLEQGKTLISLNQNFDIKDDTGWFLFGLFLLNAERDGRMIKKKFKTGKEAKVAFAAEDGELAYISGHPPYGWVSRGPKGRKILVADPYQQKWRKTILKWLADGNGYTWIARELTALKVPTSNGKSVWNECTVRAIHKRELKLAPLLRENNDERAS